MSDSARYLYCIIRNPAGGQTFDGVTPIGGAASPIYTISQNGLTAVVSDTEEKTYDSTRLNMLAHERVQERVMRDRPILPVRFGTIAGAPSATERIKSLLEKRRSEFEHLLADIEGKVELGLKALWKDENSLFREILAESPVVAGLRASLLGKSPEATHFERIRLGQIVKNTLELKRKAAAALALEPLRRIALTTVENAIILDKMILNAAFLVERTREPEFDRAVSNLDQAMGQRMAFRYIGPVPPYNFVNIVVNWQEL